MAQGSIEVSLYETDYIDSSALGMLLVLRDLAVAKQISNLTITGAKGGVKQVLQMAKFEKFFTLA
jgi:anti-anti-sigma regulatory factor